MLKGFVVLPLLAVALAAAGCGSGGSHSTTSASHHHMKKMSHKKMAMGNSGKHTAAAMAGMAMAHAELMAASSPHYGRVLYDKDHFALYMFSADHGSTSTCYGACSSAHGGWPPLLTKGAPHVAGLQASLLGTTRRKDGMLQVTYGGHPLYYWSGDTSKTIMCQHVKLHGGFWYVVNPNGTANMHMGVGTMGSM
jgi:predicted lipoprotein with Yx(FWY)xxD motif